MIKPLKSQAWACRRLKPKREEHLMKYVVSIYTYEKKQQSRKGNNEEGDNQQKNQDLLSTTNSKTHFSL